MFATRQTILASRPAAMVLALSLALGLSAPLMMLSRAHAATDPTPLPCTENNNNGCTELSPTPPQETVAVPPNIVLMLDDSGSMRWDVMPDYSFLSDTSAEGLIDADVNGVYYNPTVPYLPPPQADGTPYPQANFDAALINGFDTSSATVDLSTYRGVYDSYNVNYIGTPVAYSISEPRVGATPYAPNRGANGGCPTGTAISGGAQPGYCAFNDKGRVPSVPFNFFDASNGYFYVSRCSSVQDLYRYKSGGTTDQCLPGISFFTYTTTNPAGGYIRHYVAKTAGDCAAAGLSSDVCDESDAARQNVANWFSYYHTRILMAQSGLMTAFDKLSPNYRFGFGSINGGNNAALPSPSGSFGGKRIAEVQRFGDGASGTQRAAFWTWISGLVPPKQGTPLRLSLQAVGKYYQNSQPWTTMPGDPGYTTGSTTVYACRASYAILTTDGFWNGGNPSGTAGSANADGPTFSPPSGKTYPVTGYVAQPPFSGGGAVSNGSAVSSLADVATYYWENDLQTGISNEVAPSTQDPAFWQHMTTFTVGLGFSPVGITPSGTTVPQIIAWAQGGTPIPGWTDSSWPTPSPDNQGSENNIADLAHAAVNGHGDFFNAKNPQTLAAAFTSALADISARNVEPTPAAVNAGVLTVGALSFGTGYSTKDWSGQFVAKTLDDQGNVIAQVWDAGAKLTAADWTKRMVYTDAYTATPTPAFTSFQFTAGNVTKLDAVENAGLMSPASASSSDTAAARIDYLLGDRAEEGTGKLYRARTSVLGAIIRSQPVYVSYPSGGYSNNWPSESPEAVAAAASDGTDDKSYGSFVTDHADRPGTVYVGANDGMLHAFAAPAPTGCAADGTGCGYGDGGTELWAFVPRAVYANLGNLTSATNFHFRPTVDETPVTRDVFFAEGDNKWHTILAGGVGIGGRGVYALDITNPTAFSADDVLWEFDSDMTMSSGCVATYGDCKSSDLGYTVSQPNIGRLHNGKWVVLVPNGYFPDCSTPDIPTDPSLPSDNPASCQAIAAQAPMNGTGADAKPYSALFVLDAETGDVIAELKTPTDIPGVTSFGLATPVLGDYQNDQLDDVAFAGDVEGNLWRFDLSSADPAEWTVTLAYRGVPNASGQQGVQPITSMPRLFPDPATNRFMVVFGTGKFLGVGDNSSTTVQAIYGVRDQGNDATSATAYTKADLAERYLHEVVAPATLPDGTTANPNAGASLRCVTGGASDTCTAVTGTGTETPVGGVPAGKDGWFIDLKTTTSDGTQNDAGERVVVNPGAIFASNTVVIETLITGAENSDACSPSTQGAALALNATTGGSAGVSSLGGGSMAGGRVANARTSGSLPLVSALGGGQAYAPGLNISGVTNGSVFSLDAPIWRRRSWSEIQQNQ